MKEILKLGAILGIITSVCVGLLGAINSVTTPIIAAQKSEGQQVAMNEILSDADHFESVTITDESIVLEMYKGTSQGTYVGAVAKVAPEGYGGAIEILVGLDATHTIVGIEILSHAETPGLGANIDQEIFKEQYKNKVAPLETVKGVAGEQEISAITGATVTTAAVTDGVNAAVEFIVAHMEEGE